MKTTKVDMSPEAITGRMMMLDQLWELSVALKRSELGPLVERDEPKTDTNQKADLSDPPALD